MIGLIASTFDLLHAGHVHFINEARLRCDGLIFALQTAVTDRPSKNPPVQSVYERWVQLNALTRKPDVIIPYQSEDDLYNLLVTTSHDVRFLGSDYDGVDFTGKDLYKDFRTVGVKYEDWGDPIIPYVLFVPRLHDYSTTDLRNRIKSQSMSVPDMPKGLE